jgi:hypothetical protein
VVVIVLIVVNVTSSKSGATGASGGITAPTERAATPSVVAAAADISVSEMDTVGLPASVTAPDTDASQPPLVIGGKPGAIYIGGEFCPYCAAERWAIVVAFSKFGSFSGLGETTSSPWEGTPYATFSFLHSTYTSSLLTFDGVEYQGNDTHGLGTRTVVQPLTSVQSAVWATYSTRLGSGSEGFPFLDIGNRVLAMGPSYSPSDMTGLTQEQIASGLEDPADPLTREIVGAANYLSAGICSITGMRPSAVCTDSAVTAARRTLGLH